jgi:hypothetical protein
MIFSWRQVTFEHMHVREWRADAARDVMFNDADLKPIRITITGGMQLELDCPNAVYSSEPEKIASG